MTFPLGQHRFLGQHFLQPKFLNPLGHQSLGVLSALPRLQGFGALQTSMLEPSKDLEDMEGGRSPLKPTPLRSINPPLAQP
ncbi:hypothetical protein VB712_08450, partial [Spirulina sp. CCNP1310]|uniref:hypothetical protein n=1 Tax=Spirulina sp. CCNP1310 TaxID=3110249 RepID=UPI002B1F4608